MVWKGFPAFPAHLRMRPAYSRMPPQLEKKHVVPTAWQDEALARDGVSREVPCSALKGETVPDSLPEEPDTTEQLN